MPLNVDWAVHINGQNYTSRFNPYVMEIEVTDGSGNGSDSAVITLSDDGRIILPKKGAEISVSIMGVRVFTGILKTPRCTTAKGQGGLMILNAAGHDTEGPGKEGRHIAKKDATFGEYIEELGKKAGYTVKIDPELAKIKRTFWASEGRSFHHQAQQLASEYNATLKLSNRKAVIAKRGSGITPGGQALPTIQATLPGNIISADMEPYNASPVFRDVRQTFFDRKTAKFIEEKTDIRLGNASTGKASALPKGKRADKDDAKDTGKGHAGNSEREAGGGSIEMQIEPRARAEATCMVSGVRKGIDGPYRIESVTHTLKAGASGGSTTKLQLKQPGEGTGSDTRTPGQES